MPVTWRDLGLVPVPAKPQGLWTLALDYVPGGRLLRAMVVEFDAEEKPVAPEWHPDTNTHCGPDGIIKQTDTSKLLCSTALVGALIGKLGGSTADHPNPAPTAPPYDGKKVFAVGSELILVMGKTDGGPLFLTMNDLIENFPNHSGKLFVKLQDYPT
jgi:hypothetical protein